MNLRLKAFTFNCKRVHCERWGGPCGQHEPHKAVGTVLVVRTLKKDRENRPP